MKNIRPFQLILIVGFVLLAVGGLFMFANFSGGAKTGQVGTVLIWGTLDKDALGAGLQELSANNETYTNVSYVQMPEASFDRDLADAIAAGNGPDLVILSSENLFVERPKLQVIPNTSISERNFRDSFLPAFTLFLTPGGTYGIPLVLDPMVLYYNRATLASAGISAPPKTWEAVSGLAAPLVVKTADGAITRGLIPFGGYANVTNARGILSLLLLQSGVSISASTETGTHSQLSDLGQGGEFGTTAAESAVGFYAQFSDPAKMVYSWNRALPESRQVFVAGDLALYPGFASELPYLSQANPNLDFDMASIPQPGVALTRTTYGVGYAFVVPKASKNLPGALTVAYALGQGSSLRVIADGLAMAPARTALLAPEATDRFGEVYYPEALIAKTWLSPAPPTTDAIFSAMMGNISTGKLDVPAAVQAASDTLDAALR